MGSMEIMIMPVVVIVRGDDRPPPGLNPAAAPSNLTQGWQNPPGGQAEMASVQILQVLVLPLEQLLFTAPSHDHPLEHAASSPRIHHCC